MAGIFHFEGSSKKKEARRMQKRWALSFVVSLLIPILPLASGTAAAEPANADRSVDFVYEAHLADVPAGAERVVVWLPLPQTTPYQKVEDLKVTSAWPYAFAGEPGYGNRFVRFVRPDGATAAKDDAPIATLSFRVTRIVRRAGDANEVEDPLASIDFRRYLEPSRLIRIEGAVANEAVAIAGNVEGPTNQAKRLYDHIVDTVEYDKSGEGWGRGDSLYVCDARQGNCTDFHSLFIAEARHLGIPARFIMGFSIPRGESEGEIDGYHCWAEFYDAWRGWVPLDASEAFKNPDRREFFFGGLDADRVQFTVGRDIFLPEMEGEPVNFSIYPYAEVDGRPFDGVMGSFHFRERT